MRSYINLEQSCPMSIAQDSYLGPRLSALLKAFTPGLGEEPDAAPHS